MSPQEDSEMKFPGIQVVETNAGVNEIAPRSLSVAAFIGYTVIAEDSTGKSLINQPVLVRSLFDFEKCFGGPQIEKGITVSLGLNAIDPPQISLKLPSLNTMHAAVRLYFDNGGISCYVLAVGLVPDAMTGNGPLLAAIDILEKYSEPAIYSIPGAQFINDESAFYAVFAKAIESCAKLGDRFTILDCWPEKVDLITAISHFRNQAPHTTGFAKSDHLSFGAAYYPYLLTNYKYPYDEKDVMVTDSSHGGQSHALSDLHVQQPAVYAIVKKALDNTPLTIPASPAIAGIYAATDNARGIWKAPANVALLSVQAPAQLISEGEQASMNVDPVSGKSVNAIRFFPGKGILVWGARTLAGNDNEWRYVSVRRFFSLVESSVSRALQQFVFEKNDAATWLRVISMTSNFLYNYWKQGALMGIKSSEAYFVNCGLGQTMTQQDILNGILILEIGMAPVRPAEFIIIRLTQKVTS